MWAIKMRVVNFGCIDPGLRIANWAEIIHICVVHLQMVHQTMWEDEVTDEERKGPRTLLKEQLLVLFRCALQEIISGKG